MQLAWAEKIADIQPQGYVTDLANVINPATRPEIEALGTELQQKTGAQIAVVTVNSLEGQTREDYAADLYKHLGVGSKKDNRGVLLLIAPKDRQYKIEVGYGLEPVINDARAGDIGRAMVPDLRKRRLQRRDPDRRRVAQFIAADKGVQLTGVPQRTPSARAQARPRGGCPGAIFCGSFMIIRALPAGRGGRGPRRRRADGRRAAGGFCLARHGRRRWLAAEASAAAPAAGAVAAAEGLAASAAA